MESYKQPVLGIGVGGRKGKRKKGRRGVQEKERERVVCSLPVINSREEMLQ